MDDNTCPRVGFAPPPLPLGLTVEPPPAFGPLTLPVKSCCDALLTDWCDCWEFLAGAA